MNLNKIFFAGRLTRDPSTKNLPSGSSICEFGVCSNRSYTRDKVKVDDPCFLDCIAYAEKGAQISQFFKKGKAIFIEGRLKYESFEGKDGVKRSKIVLVVEAWHFVGLPASGQSLPPEEDMRMPRHDARQTGPGSAPAPQDEYSSFGDSDIPFSHNLPARWI